MLLFRLAYDKSKLKNPGFCSVFLIVIFSGSASVASVGSAVAVGFCCGFSRPALGVLYPFGSVGGVLRLYLLRFCFCGFWDRFSGSASVGVQRLPWLCF